VRAVTSLSPARSTKLICFGFLDSCSLFQIGHVSPIVARSMGLPSLEMVETDARLAMATYTSA
jgi:hypothetical protein